MNRIFLIISMILSVITFSSCNHNAKKSTPIPTKIPEKPKSNIIKDTTKTNVTTFVDTTAYIKKLKELANGDTSGLWPAKPYDFPLKGAILPFKRIVAYYGNMYSKKMGVLGEYPPKELWQKLDSEVRKWEKADSLTPVQPAIQYVVAVAQGIPMKDSSYCKRMPKVQIDSALKIAKMGKAILFLDVQVGKSNVRKEVPRLEKYLKLPQVHLAIDPEFAVKDSCIPGQRIGNMNASDINFCSQFLTNIVRKNHLPPKILIVHRFTQGMVKDYKDIRLHPEVQLVMNMDGWGAPALKYSTYKSYIYKEPVQFTGFKLFYKNDIKDSPYVMLTPVQILKLKPQPIYIQYQ